MDGKSEEAVNKLPNVFKRLAGRISVVLLFSGLVFFGSIQAAQADPGCQEVLSVFARGSGQGIGDKESSRFSDFLSSELSEAKHSFVELGNIDNSVAKGKRPDDKNTEYPATDLKGWLGDPGYGGSVETGTNELVKYLNERTARCPHEAIVLGGYSQGADVIGWALERQGYGAVNSKARQQIAFVALYGDPKRPNCNGDWDRGDAGCGTVGRMPRSPYVPEDFVSRTGSWCDYDDGICAVRATTLGAGTHGRAYAKKWIPESAAEIAAAAQDKVGELASSASTDDGEASSDSSSTATGIVSWTNNQGLLLHSGGRVVATIPEGTKLEIKCQINDTSVTGPHGPTTLWDKVAYKSKTGFVSDAYVNTGSDQAVAGKC